MDDPFRELYEKALKHAEWEVAEYGSGRLKSFIDDRDVTASALQAAKAQVQHLKEMLTHYDVLYSKKPLP